MSQALERIQNLFSGDAQSVIEKLWYKRITEEGYLVDKNDHYQAFFSVRTADLYSMDDEELDRYILQFTNMLRIYTAPIKIYSMTYPTETRRQQTYYAKLIKRYSEQMEFYRLNQPNPRRLEELENKRERAIEQFRTQTWVEDHLKDLIFFIAVYGETKDAIEENIRSFRRLSSRSFQMERITNHQKLVQILKKLHNMTNEL